MSRRLVVDASALMAILLDPDERVGHVGALMSSRQMHAPSLLPYEIANALRRLRAAGIVSASEATAAHVQLRQLAVQYWPYEVLADRGWELGGALTAYDAAYVALAERLDAPLVTADQRLARAPGLRCEVVAVRAP